MNDDTSGHGHVDQDVRMLQQGVYDGGVGPAGRRDQGAGGGHQARPHREVRVGPGSQQHLDWARLALHRRN